MLDIRYLRVNLKIRFNLSMKKKCHKCGMIRSIKDLVKLEGGGFICFSCWNKYLREKKLIK